MHRKLISLLLKTGLDGKHKESGMKKIFSGDFRYVTRLAKEYYALGYHIVKQKRWGDGKYTIVMECE